MVDMKVIIVRNTPKARVIQRLGMQNKEFYNESDIRVIKKTLEFLGHDVSILEGDTTLMRRLRLFSKSCNNNNGQQQKMMVFNLSYGVQGECRYTHIPSILELAGIPYVGSGPKAHTLCLDKYLTKIILRDANLPTPDFQLFKSEKDKISDKFNFPVVVKPQCESMSFGVSVVKNKNELRKAVRNILKFDVPIAAV